MSVANSSDGLIPTEMTAVLGNSALPVLLDIVLSETRNGILERMLKFSTGIDF